MHALKCLSRIYLNLYQYIILLLKNVDFTLFSILHIMYLSSVLTLIETVLYLKHRRKRFALELRTNIYLCVMHLFKETLEFFTMLTGEIQRKCTRIILSLPEQV